jgi:hypothetical protein
MEKHKRPQQKMLRSVCLHKEFVVSGLSHLTCGGNLKQNIFKSRNKVIFVAGTPLAVQ